MGDIRSVRGFFVGRVLLWCEDGGLSCCTTPGGACDYPQLRIKQVDSVVWQAWPESICVARGGCRDRSRDGTRAGGQGLDTNERMVRGELGRMGGF